jgi:hypothetical protein
MPSARNRNWFLVFPDGANDILNIFKGPRLHNLKNSSGIKLGVNIVDEERFGFPYRFPRCPRSESNSK